MPSYYQSQFDTFNLPLAVMIMLATAHVRSHEIIYEDTYTPTLSTATNYSGAYYGAADSLRDELDELRLLKNFADKIISQSVHPTAETVELLNKNFWQLV